MNKFATAACLAMVLPLVGAQAHDTDSLRTIGLQEVEVVSTRATGTTPVAYTNVTKQQLKKQNFGVDIPYLLSFTPSVLTTSDAGAGVGYTAIRIRGTDASRINVTTNGIPMNDAESNSIYWVNTPDIASSLQDIQIQRGAGTSTNGAGAFGGSINMQTQGISPTPYAEFSGSYGSFHTHKETVKASTGLINNHWGVDIRLSNIHSDGYRDRAFADLKSYFVQAGYYHDRGSLKFITFGGKEETYHAWDGIDKETLKSDRTYNPNGVIEDDNGNPTGFYDNQIDLYRQTHYQLLWNHELSDTWHLNAALHYTDGDGYYEEYKNRRTLTEYGLTPYIVDGDTVTRSNLIRRKLVKSGFGGAIFSVDYKSESLTASIGGAANHYENTHRGRVMWVKNYLGKLNPDHEYYRNKGKKDDANLYAKANYVVTDGLSLYADLQLRHLRYRIHGTGDQWDWRINTPQQLAVDESFTFFNPKAGAYWSINKQQAVYASFSVAHKEPTRNNYTDNLLETHPHAERMFDYEAGYTFRHQRFHAGVNLYLMDYDNQLVLTGALNEIGEPVTANVKESYRMGIELMAGIQIIPALRWDVNATWSRNRVKLDTGRVPIAFSPDFMANSLIAFDLRRWSASLQSQYVGKQFLSNENDSNCMLDAWFVNNLNLAYTFGLKGVKSITVGATIYNLFNEMYESNGYASDGYAAYYPNAGIHALAHLTLTF
ncbi:MAG: TonB-dependent receptor [Prevotellaceae bacterium]|jgi:iron complex outermembrane receptor protein|nr:TonB-dependent receptor [Prevotellaceae bacterium]